MKKNGTRAKAGDNAGAHRGQKKRSSNDTTTLSGIGLTKDQSSKWQQLAEVPEDEFEAEVTKPGPKPTTSGLLAKRKEPEWSIDSKALWAWGCIIQFKRQGLLDADQGKLFALMTEPMQEEVLEEAPRLIAWLKGFLKKVKN